MEFGGLLKVIIASTGLINAIIISVLVLTSNNGNLKANRLLAMLIFSVALKMCYALVINIPHEWTAFSTFICFIAETGYLSFGPVLFLYITALIDNNRLKAWFWLLLLPAILPFIVWQLFKENIPLWAEQIYFLTFLIISFIKIYRFFSKESSNYLASQKKWAYMVWSFLFLFWLSINLLLIDFKYYILELSVFVSFLIYILIISIVKSIGFKKSTEKPKPYKNSQINDNEISEILDKVMKIFKDKEIYKDPDMTLPKVAEMIKVTPHKLSQVINQKMDMNFTEFLNSHRIRDIKQALVSSKYEKQTIASIAYDYGFNSLSAFNTAFKRHTNQTPSQYKASMVMNN